jgi:hypothetical protein
MDLPTNDTKNKSTKMHIDTLYSGTDYGLPFLFILGASQSVTGAGFVRVLHFPFSIVIPPIPPHSLIIPSQAQYGLDIGVVVKRT